MNVFLIEFWGIVWILMGSVGGDFCKTFCRTITFMWGIFFVVIGCILYEQPDFFEPLGPTAMDVYQGKTRLEIHYTDSIPTDSIVVYNDEYKKEK